MKSSATGRVFATIFIGLMFGLYTHFDQTRWVQRGHDAFLAAQSHRFDRIAQYHSALNMLIAGVILAGIAVGLYELVAVGFTKILPTAAAEE